MVVVSDDPYAAWIVAVVLQIWITALNADIQQLLPSNAPDVSCRSSVHDSCLGYRKKVNIDSKQ